LLTDKQRNVELNKTSLPTTNNKNNRLQNRNLQQALLGSTPIDFVEKATFAGDSAYMTDKTLVLAILMCYAQPLLTLNATV